ncbi:MAG TPA: RNA polymerase sigma factor [Acidimicrobiales bacterium]|nr:RNA polymerase sigma factor [Acidimicrobiales bacterium]
MDESTDAAVIAASIDDPSCFSELFDRHARVIFRYLVRRVGPDADDLLGEVFRVAFERRESYDSCRPDAAPWLYGIATRVVSKQRRSEGRRIKAMARYAAQRAGAEDMAERVAASTDASDDWSRVADAVADLPSAEWDTLLLYVWEELSYEQIAAALDIPVGTVRSRLNRARARLRDTSLPSERMGS